MHKNIQKKERLYCSAKNKDLPERICEIKRKKKMLEEERRKNKKEEY